jgi:endonuclease/exonuclease/phosphatase family metal-dependent hydrolase
MPPVLRLVAFNIFEGLRTSAREAEDRRLIDRERADAAKAVVADFAPDILVLNEALFCREFDGRTTDYAELFGFTHQAAALYDEAWGNAILCRHPIVEWREMRTEDRGGLIARIVAPGADLTVASYHPHPRRKPADKALDFARLLDGLSGPLIVCGDLNCISPDDGIDRDRLVEAFRRFSNEAETTVDQFLESGKQVFAVLGQHGLVDAVPPAGRRYSIPTDLINLDKSSGIRIDHILANSQIEIVDGEVAHSADTNKASDHHPVMIDFRVRAT